MAEMNAAERDALPDADFAIVRMVGRTKTRDYPIQDKDHAVAALARVETNGTPADKKAVLAAVCKRYSDLPACSSSTSALAAHVASKSNHLS